VAGFDESAAGAEAAGASAAIGAAAFGMSAADAATARPRVNNAEVIRVPDLFMRSPNGGIDERSKEYARSTRFLRDEDHFTNRGSITPANEPLRGSRGPEAGVRGIPSPFIKS
jgi:hypothetical protein